MINKKAILLFDQAIACVEKIRALPYCTEIQKHDLSFCLEDLKFSKDEMMCSEGSKNIIFLNNYLKQKGDRKNGLQ